MEFFSYIKEAATRKELAHKVFEFLSGQDRPLRALVVHRFHPRPFSFELALNSFDRSRWLEEILKTNLKLNFALPIAATGHFLNYFGLPDQNNAHILFYGFVFTDTPDKKSIDYLQTWRQLDYGYLQAERFQQENLSVEWANLISQLLHDINSLIELTPKTEKNEELETRLIYQKKVQDRLLLYIRPLDILAVSLPVRSLIDHSLKMIDLNAEHFTLTISEQVSDIEVDAELFARAFNELILNALSAVKHKTHNIRIDVSLDSGRSPIFPGRWLKLSIKDNGPGINPDFLEFVAEPFFTTRKTKGHTGLGLSLAKKIIEAHHGHLELYSEYGAGTEAVVYLPLKEA